jgi:hypothetical protein
MNKNQSLVASIAVGCLLHAGSLSAADSIRFGEETFEFSGGFVWQSYETTVNVKDKESGIGADVSLEDTLGYDDDETPWLVGGTWRFADRHRLTMSYFETNRDVKAVATENIDIGEGEVIPVGAGYSSSLDFKVIPIKYSYSFIKSEKHEFYGSVGLHWNSIDYDVRGDANLGADVWDSSLEATADAPMPLIGAGYDYYINDRWKVGVTAEAFYIELGEKDFNFEGSIVNVGFSTSYYIFNNVGLGLGINYFKLDVDVDDPDWNGSLEYSYWGPSASLSARF